MPQIYPFAVGWVCDRAIYPTNIKLTNFVKLKGVTNPLLRRGMGLYPGCLFNQY